jgi:hypothetical protein
MVNDLQYKQMSAHESHAIVSSMGTLIDFRFSDSIFNGSGLVRALCAVSLKTIQGSAAFSRLKPESRLFTDSYLYHTFPFECKPQMGPDPENKNTLTDPDGFVS